MLSNERHAKDLELLTSEKRLCTFVCEFTHLHSSETQNRRQNCRCEFPHGRKNTVTIFLNGQFIKVYTYKPHINHKHSLVIITPRIFSAKMLYFG